MQSVNLLVTTTNVCVIDSQNTYLDTYMHPHSILVV